MAWTLTWRAGPAQVRHGTKATWQGRAWPTRGAGGADMLQEATRTLVRGAMWQGGLAVGGPMG